MFTYKVVEAIQQALLNSLFVIQRCIRSFVNSVGTNQLVHLYRVLLALTV